MGIFDRFRKKNKEEGHIDEYTDMPVEEDENKEHINIIIEDLKDFGACDRILTKVKSGNIVLAKMKGLKASNTDELKQCISKLRTVTASYGGDIAGVADDWIILTPKTAKVVRQQAVQL